LKARITKTLVNEILAKPDRAACITVWDPTLPGFGIAIYATGKASFFINYRDSGNRQRRLKLGTYGKLTPEQARSLAIQRLAEVEQGRDPLKEKRAAREGLSVAELARRFLDQHSSKKKTAAEDRRILDRYVLPQLGTRRVDEITRSDVAKLHARVTSDNGPYMANHTLTLLGVLFQFAEDRGERPEGSNPARRIKRNREVARNRLVSEAELARLGDALVQLEAEGGKSVTWAAVFRLLLVTGMRRGEVFNLRWSEVDLDAGCLRLADSKTGPKSLPLSAPAREILEAQPRGTALAHVFFPGRRGSLANPVFPVWKRVLANAGLDDLRLHDLRHAFASTGAGAGVPIYTIGKLLGHSQPTMTARYAHLSDDARKAAADRIGTLVAAALDGKKGAEVVQLPR